MFPIAISVASFPTKKYLTGSEAGAWIEVGASGPKNDASLKAGFPIINREAEKYGLKFIEEKSERDMLILNKN